MKTIQLSENDLQIIRKIVLPVLQDIPGHAGNMDEDDEALWTFIDKLKGASDE